MNTEEMDLRHILTGRTIPTENYCDQPFVAQTDDNAWLCSVTTGPGHEGARGQHVTTLRSMDHGRTWSTPVAVEAHDSPENSYSVMLKMPAVCPGASGSVAKPGRIYIFYNHNTHNLSEVKCHNGVDVFSRTDSLGEFVLKYSDDHGRSWSARRYPIPVREFACDRENIYNGAVRFFWNVGKPFLHDGAVYVSLHKVGQMGEGFFQQSEGVLLRSDTLLTEPDPAKARWETLPDGEIGLRTPPGGGPIAEEQSYCVLSDGSFYCVYRSIDGHPVESYSHDGGHTWSEPRYKRYADGRLMKNPRAANFVWKCENGKFLYWFHNHGGHFIRDLWGQRSETNGLVKGGRSPYDDRNPAWLCGGVEIDTPHGREIAWSQPEIALYDDDPMVRMSYPDLIEERGTYYLSETQKEMARIHTLDPAMLSCMWDTVAGAPCADSDTRPALLSYPEHGAAMPLNVPMIDLPKFVTVDHQRADFGMMPTRRGFTLEISLELADLSGKHTVLDSRTDWGQGLALETTGHGTVALVMNDGRTENRWECDPDMLEPGQRHRIAVIVEGGPRLILFVIDGKLNDGGEHRQFGWGRFSPHLMSANGGDTLRLHPGVHSLRIFDRPLLVNEAVADTAPHKTSEHRDANAKAK